MLIFVVHFLSSIPTYLPTRPATVRFAAPRAPPYVLRGQLTGPISFNVCRPPYPCMAPECRPRSRPLCLQTPAQQPRCVQLVRALRRRAQLPKAPLVLGKLEG